MNMEESNNGSLSAEFKHLVRDRVWALGPHPVQYMPPVLLDLFMINTPLCPPDPEGAEVRQRRPDQQ